MEEAIAVLKQYRSVFQAEKLDKKACESAHKILSKKVIETIDLLDIKKDSLVYTFSSGFKTEIDKYFNGLVKNPKEAKRFAKQQADYDRRVAKGKEPDWKVVPASYTDLELVKRNMLNQIDRMVAHFEELIAANDNCDFDAKAVALIDFLKANASGVVNKVTKRIAKARAIKLMEEVGISEPRKRYNQYPFEFSGGMRQRIVIAIALAADPDILICDEPTTALDVTIQSQILELINRLKAERQLSIIFITHDLGVVANMADRIAVMYAGKIVEYGTSEDIFYHSAHPYTWALLSSMPDLDTNEKLDAIPGTPPDMLYPPVGDAFAQRNKYAMKIDFERQPPMFKITDTHYAATWLLHPDAPKVEPPKAILDRIARMEEKRGVQNDQ
ncbi:MAG: ATP-binding cassette domain-containing protein [Clostridia bacterium]|nr:ATP-binding cassette domain-containing protein [Clostridia bacterium]